MTLLPVTFPKTNHRYFSNLRGALKHAVFCPAPEYLTFSWLGSSKVVGCTYKNDGFLHAQRGYSNKIWSFWKSTSNVSFYNLWSTYVLQSLFILFVCFRWQGSLYKLTFPGLFLYLAVYYSISFMYRFVLNQEQRTYVNYLDYLSIL